MYVYGFQLLDKYIWSYVVTVIHFCIRKIIEDSIVIMKLKQNMDNQKFVDMH